VSELSTWIVTGASRGLGRALCRGLAGRGHQVIAIARDRARLTALQQACATDRIVPWPLDLADADAIAPALATLQDAYPRIDGLINNAGVGRYQPLLDHTEGELRTIVQVNLSAVIQLCYAVLPAMLARGSGHIVNVGSDLGRRPLANMAAYVASKHGLAGFSHSLLREVKSAGVRVSLVNPGMIDTDFGGNIEGTRAGSHTLAPAELAALIVQLIEQPAHLVIDELSVHPLQQAEY